MLHVSLHSAILNLPSLFPFPCVLVCRVLLRRGPCAYNKPSAYSKPPIPCPSPPQYLVHLHVVSQLHALDGGTTYGLPHDKLLPPVRAMGAEAGRGEPIMLEYRGLQTAFDLWDTGVREEGTYLYTLEGRRTVLDLLLRMACAILDSADYFAAGGRGSSSSSGGAGGRDSGMGASEAGSSQGQPPAAPGPGPAAVLWDVDQRNSLRALLCALDIDTGLAERDNSADSSSSGDSGSGRGGSGNGASGGNGENGRGSGGSGMDASGSGAGAGGSGGGGACLGSKHDGREGAGAGPAVANSAGPAFARPWRWWPLAVRTVRALMDEGVDHALPALCAVMASLWEAAEPPESGAPGKRAEPQDVPCHAMPLRCPARKFAFQR